MMRWCLWLLLLPCFGQAQKFTATDLKQLKLYSTGIFANDAQVKTDSSVLHATLKVQPIWQKRKDGAWLFAERTDTAQTFQVWHVYLQDDSTLIMQFLDFKETAKAIQLSKDINQQSNLFIYNFFTRHGCEVFLKKNKTAYAGNSNGKECFVSQSGTEYMTYKIELAKNVLSWQQGAFDKNDKELPLALNGHYKFIKQAKSLK